jgi:hypothetical protein
MKNHTCHCLMQLPGTVLRFCVPATPKQAVEGCCPCCLVRWRAGVGKGNIRRVKRSGPRHRPTPPRPPTTSRAHHHHHHSQQQHRPPGTITHLHHQHITTTSIYLLAHPSIAANLPCRPSPIYLKLPLYQELLPSSSCRSAEAPRPCRGSWSCCMSLTMRIASRMRC